MQLFLALPMFSSKDNISLKSPTTSQVRENECKRHIRSKKNTLVQEGIPIKVSKTKRNRVRQKVTETSIWPDGQSNKEMQKSLLQKSPRSPKRPTLSTKKPQLKPQEIFIESI